MPYTKDSEQYQDSNRKAGAEIECMVYPSSIRTTVSSAANEELQINNTLTLTILVKERARQDIIVTFPWGKESQHMTVLSMARGITCSPLTGHWMASRESEPEIDDYWRISGGSEEDTIIQIQFDGIVAVSEGITCILVKSVREHEENVQETPFYQIPLFKSRPILRINTFTADKATVQKGKAVTFHWNVQGAQSCVLDPGNLSVQAQGERSFFIQKEEVFTLRAFYGRKAVSETRRIYLAEKTQ